MPLANTDLGGPNIFDFIPEDEPEVRTFGALQKAILAGAGLESYPTNEKDWEAALGQREAAKMRA